MLSDDLLRSLLENFQRASVLVTNLVIVATIGRMYWDDYTDVERQRGRQPLLSQEQCREIGEAADRIHAAVKVFEGARWFWGGLQAGVNATDERYLIGTGAGWSMRLGSLAGRCLITLADDASGHQVTLITADDEKPFQRMEWGNKSMGPMGMQSIEATEETALRLIRLATLADVELQPAKLAIA